MNLLILFSVCSTIIISTSAVSFTGLVTEEWELFKTEHNKSYLTEVEEKFRMKIFMDNKLKIARHNKRFRNGEVSFELAMNKFGDMLNHEFVRTMNGYKPNFKTEADESEGVTFIPPFNYTPPDIVDWRAHGAVTEVKDQKHCASDWAFGATGALEGQNYRSTGKLVSLSEQNLIDCTIRYGNNGCNGGVMEYAFKYVQDNRGIDTEKSYPYEAEGDRCRYNQNRIGAIDKGFVNIQKGSEYELKLAVASIGPIAVSIDASYQSFQFYSGGVYYEPNCSSDNLDHAVLVVGYGTTAYGEDYWLVKNSWGRDWGWGGYIKMARNNNNCGIATSAIYPLV